VRLGLAGGLGAPEALAAAFALGAEFVLTGSINQCTPEAGTSDLAKDMLAAADIGDFDMAPAGDMFEIGARVQVLRRGTLFAARGNRLLDLYQRHDSLEQIDGSVRAELEAQTFGRSLDEVWAETEAYYRTAAPGELIEAGRNPKKRMGMVFRWYFVHSSRLAQAGDRGGRANFQIHAGPAMGACNRWLAGTPLADWRRRHVDELARGLMTGAADILAERVARWYAVPLCDEVESAGTSLFL
jgi:trans-AT polyketide synthase/acyltransferase/oxidoreductase domain-containing protein